MFFNMKVRNEAFLFFYCVLSAGLFESHKESTIGTSAAGFNWSTTVGCLSFEAAAQTRLIHRLG